MNNPASLTVPKTPTFTGTLGCKGSTAAAGAAADRVPGAVVGAEQPIRLETSARPTRAPIGQRLGTRSSRERLPGGCSMRASLVQSLADDRIIREWLADDA